MSEPQHQDGKIGADKSVVGPANADKNSDYKVGRGRPPKEYQWKKGQSGNRSGRPRKKRDQKSTFEGIINERVVIREDGKERKVSKYDALIRSHLAKGIKGDTRSAKFIMDEAGRLGIGDEQDSSIFVPVPPKSPSAESDALFANLKPDLLSEDEQIELVRLAQTLDRGGDFMALSMAEFSRIKQITNKGCGKESRRARDVAPAQSS